MEIRKLKATDFFKVSTLAQKLNLDVSKILRTINALRKDNVEENSIEIINVILKEVFYKLNVAETEIYDLLATVTNEKVETIKELEIEDFTKLLIDLVKSSGFLSFFK